MYHYFDLHCDTLLKLYKGGVDITDNKLMINIKTLSLYKPMIQCFSLFNDGELTLDDYFDAVGFIQKVCECIGMTLCRSFEDIASVRKRGGIGAVLTAEALGNTSGIDEDAVARLRKRGYLMAGLVWNFDNALCGGCLGDGGGVTPAGERILRRMEQEGMAVDVSHMSDAAFYETADQFCKPLVASHSNCRAICHHPRNLTDDMIRKIALSGGVVGVNFYPPFLSRSGSGIADAVRHIRHIAAVGGARCAAVGSDFDGIPFAADGLASAADVSALFEALEGKNDTKSYVCDIGFNNVYNLFEKYEFSH